MVDTSAEVSIIPHTGPDLSRTPNFNFIVANGSRIKSYSFRQIVLMINDSKYTWCFQVADVHKSNLGTDFFHVHGLLVDLTNK